MYLIQAKVDATAPDFPGMPVEWKKGQVKFVHESLIEYFRSNPAAWTVVSDLDQSPVMSSNGLNGRVRKISSMGLDIFSGNLSLNVAPVSHRFPSGNNNGAGGFTLQGVMTVPYAFYGVVPSLINTTTAALTGIKASVFSMSDPTTVVGTPLALTVSGSATISLAAGVGSSPQTINSETACDPVSLSCVPRTDGGAGYLIGWRVYTPAANGVDPRVLLNGLADNALGPWNRFSSAKSGDNTAQVNLTGFGGFNCCFPLALQFLTDAPVISALYAGDSITLGLHYSDSPIQYASGFDLAVLDAQNLGKRIEPINLGAGSQTAANYYINGINAVNRYRPTVAAFSVGSPNDVSPYAAYSDGWVAASMALAAQWITYCRSLNVTPCLVTCSPNTGISVSQESNRRLLVEKVKALAQSAGCKLIDRDSIWTDYSTTSGGYKSGLSYDAIHPNGSGYLAEKPLWSSMFATIA